MVTTRLSARSLYTLLGVVVAGALLLPTSAFGKNPLRRIGRRLDRSLITIDRAIQGIEAGKLKKPRRHLRKAKKRLRRNLADADLAAADVELAAAVELLRNRHYSPTDDADAVLLHADSAAAFIRGSVTFDESHDEGIFYLGRSGNFSRRRFNIRGFTPRGVIGPFDILRVEADGADIFVDNMIIFFFDDEGPVPHQTKKKVRFLEHGERKRFRLEGRFLDTILIDGISVSSHGHGKLKFWGIVEN